MNLPSIRTAVIACVAAVMILPVYAQQRPAAAAFRNLPSPVPEARVRAHTIAPDHVKNIQIEDVDSGREVLFRMPIPKTALGTTPKADVNALGLAIHTVLKDLVAGYILQVRQNGTLIHTGIWNWAQTPADQNQGWTQDTRMHIASVSKLLTAIGMMRALDTRKISYDSAIAPYLPAYWSKGKNVDKITFRHLLTNRSGFSTGSSDSDYAFMKARVAAGVASPGTYDYENMNFGLCRILIPIVMGNIAKTTTFIDNSDLNDKAWDAVTVHHYKSYMQNTVFTPAGVSNAGFAPDGPKRALAYPSPAATQKGWNSGDLATMAGGAGWRLSSRELLDVMHHVRRRNTIIPSERTQYLLDNKFGIDQVIDTAAGKLYNKNGRWTRSSGTEQSVAYFLPNGMELVLFVNSPIGKEGFSLRGIVKDAFISSLGSK